MQTYIKSFISAPTISVSMDVHKKAIALCVYNVSAGVILGKWNVPHDLPKITQDLQNAQGRHVEVRSCYKNCGYVLYDAA